MNNDLISRNAAIGALDALCDRECEYSKKQRSFMCGACRLGSAFDVIDELPSVQTENMQLSKEDATKGTTFDCISREAAIEALGTPHGILYPIRTIEELPSTQPYTAEEIQKMQDLESAEIEKAYQLGYEEGKKDAQRWIPVTERLPEDIRPVIVTWKNNDPESYYQSIVGKHFIGVAHFKGGKWYWYSSTTEDFLAEYGRYDGEEFDEAIEVIAWRELPEPYKERQG